VSRGWGPQVGPHTGIVLANVARSCSHEGRYIALVTPPKKIGRFHHEKSEALASGQNPNYPQIMAGVLIACLPTVVVYIALGKYFVSGLMSGSVK